eukprot:3937772-Rhodomonas_salina.1
MLRQYQHRHRLHHSPKSVASRLITQHHFASHSIPQHHSASLGHHVPSPPASLSITLHHSPHHSPSLSITLHTALHHREREGF